MADLSGVIGMQTGTNFALLKQSLFKWITKFGRGCFPFFQFPNITWWQSNTGSKFIGACASGYNNIEPVNSAPTWILFYQAKCPVRIELYIQSHDTSRGFVQFISPLWKEAGCLPYNNLQTVLESLAWNLAGQREVETSSTPIIGADICAILWAFCSK